MPEETESHFETALEQLEAIVQSLERGEPELSTALAKYETGVRLLNQCYGLLERAERSVALLTGVDAQGNPTTAPFDATATLETESTRMRQQTTSPSAPMPNPDPKPARSRRPSRRLSRSPIGSIPRSDRAGVAAPWHNPKTEPPHRAIRLSISPLFRAFPARVGTARRAFADVAEFPGTIHLTEIKADAVLHHHKRLTETYYILECDPGALMQLDDDLIPLHPGRCILIPPGVRHRAIGLMKVLIVVFPKFDPEDEYTD